MRYDPELMDGEGRNPYDLYDGEACMDDDVCDITFDDDPSKVIEVVYCKDCKWRDLPFQYPRGGCRWHPMEEVEDLDFCSYGETADGKKPKAY